MEMTVQIKGKVYKTKSKKGMISLDLSKKGIEDIGDIIGLERLINLQKLDLSNNKITEIKGLENLENLRVLNLKNNNIKEISGLSKLKRLKEILLDGNPVYKTVKKSLKKGAQVAVTLSMHIEGKKKEELAKMRAEEQRLAKEKEAKEWEARRKALEKIDTIKDVAVTITQFDEKLDSIKMDTELIIEYTKQIEDIFDRVDDLEQYLIKKLGNDFQKIKVAYQQYKEGKIGRTGLIKEGLKALGKMFIKKLV